MQTLECIGADPRATQPTDSAVFTSNVKSVTEGVLAAGDAATARAILERLRPSVANLMDTLIRISANATRPGTRDADDSDSVQHAQQAVDHIGQWIGEEHEYWCHG